MNILQHPESAQLASFARGELISREASDIEQHVAQCQKCCLIVAGVADDRLQLLAREAVDTLGPIAETRASEGGGREEVADGCRERDVEIEMPAALKKHPRYQLLHPLGQGGMGTVFLAQHRLMKRLVALKIISPDLIENQTAIARFRQEVQAAASLNHPNLVTAHDAEHVDETHFLVMEFVDGTSLDRLVEQAGPLPCEDACDYICQAANGLQHAHEAGLVHRDIKPSNMIVTADATLKVLDFGLARLAGELAGNDEQPLTQDRVVLGTPDFIAPEQVEHAGSADRRSDIYSLGCTLYYLMTARVPFPLSSSTLKLSAHLLVEPKSISELRPEIPEGLTAVIEKMMAKDPANRYATASAVSVALAPFARQPSAVSLDGGRPSPTAESSASSPFPARRKLVLGMGAAALVIFALGLASLIGSALVQPHGMIAENDDEVYVLFLLAPDMLWYEDFAPIYQRLKEQGVNITIASSRPEITVDPRSFAGDANITVDRQLDDVGRGQFDVIVLCGGIVESFCDDGPDATQVRRILRQHLEDRMFVAAMCHGQKILAKADLLHGVECAEPGIHDWGQEDGVIWNSHQQVIKDGQIITASDSEFADAFTTEILQLLGKYEGVP